ncbi:MAG: hypothetical protein FVQ84_12085 [Planctomycetes bacterium]|nr:hypothetical protein [Planctomycetota bacterium]
MNINIDMTSNYKEFASLTGLKNKPNSNPIKPIQTQFNPKQTQFKANQTQSFQRQTGQIPLPLIRLLWSHNKSGSLYKFIMVIFAPETFSSYTFSRRKYVTIVSLGKLFFRTKKHLAHKFFRGR